MRAGDFAYLDLPTPVGLAHRGGAAFGPNVGLENTLAAFRRAVAMGYRYLETDVHATRDGRVVAFHDTVLDRVSDRRGAIATLPYEAVREARIGGAEPIPLLSDLFEQFPDTRINIDIKADDALAPDRPGSVAAQRDRAGLHRVVQRAPAAGGPRRPRPGRGHRRRPGRHRAAAVHARQR